MERCEKYCSQLGVNVVPKIFWTKKDMKKLPIRVRCSRLGRFTWGWCPHRGNFIFIMYARHGNLTELDNTLRHELIHFRFPGLSHGKNFELAIKNLKNGMIWPPFDRISFVREKMHSYSMWAFRNMFQ